MQEILNQIRSRFKGIENIISSEYDDDYFRMLQEEEKLRIQNQNFVIGIIKTSRALEDQQKIQYYRKSEEIMKAINNEYIINPITDEQILQKFIFRYVDLYKKFFQEFEAILKFKAHLRILLKHTNPNIIADLIRYLIDFTRDYYQSTLLWFRKNSSKPKLLQSQINNQGNNLNKKKPILFETVTLPTINPEIRRQESLQRIGRKRNTNYDILNLVLPSITNSIQKSMSADQVKIKVNEIYKQCFSRNNFAKTTLLQYRQQFRQKHKVNEKQTLNGKLEKISVQNPFQLSLAFDKNGSIYIHVEKPAEKSKIKLLEESNSRIDTKITSKIQGPRLQHSNRQRNATCIINKSYAYELSNIVIGSNYKSPTLTEGRMKVLRISQNFLPKLGIVKEQDKMTKKIEEILVSYQKKLKQVHEINQQVRYFNGQIVESQNNSKFDRNRLKSIKKNYKVNNQSEKQEDIKEWIKNIKQIETKKIMGLS